MRPRDVAAIILLAVGTTIARADCDTTAPALTAFNFTPTSINTTSASQTVTCTMTLTDALSGVASATCSFTSPDLLHQQSCSAAAPTTGTPQNGTWSCLITFPRYAPSGTWTAGVLATDAVGNLTSVDPNDQGLPSLLTVTSDPDTVAPALTNFTLNPTAVTVSAAAQNVTCNMTLTDAKSGVAFASCQLSAPDSDQTVSCGSATPASGTRNNGVFSCVLSVPRYADAGTWTSEVVAADQVGNTPAAPFAPAATLAVTSVPEDIVVPSLSSFAFNPTSISVGGSSKPVVCTIGVADSPAGVSAATCTFSIFAFVPPFDFVNQRQSCTATVPATGTRNSGTFQCTVVMPRYAAGGAWSSGASLVDLAGNASDYPQAQTLNVACDAGPLQTTCRFSTKTSLTWDPVAGATQYNVYRGPLTNLVDANLDHLPDGGYGTCQNSRDGNLTDTAFADADLPTVAQKGFFYLVSQKISGVESGLGTNSLGAARTIAAPCP
ncbi:MAG TPA: hypothetical protein VJ826_16390 [Candidatus Polarisedimenticolaceae bacterium]|nr:hypothetical protein [Candidatus Polarisedimenticolaceae bacterium]